MDLNSEVKKMKSPKQVAEDFRKKPAGMLMPDRAEKIAQGKCATCGKPIKEEDFADDLSKREYEISGMCQKCQDEVFLPSEREE